MLRILMARENIDKLRFAIEKIAEADEVALAAGKPVEVRLIVPDQFTLTAEHSVFEYTGKKAFTNPTVISLGRLAEKTAEETGGRLRYLDKYGKHMLIAHIMKQERAALGKYARLSNSTLFIEKMSDAVMELKSHVVSPDELDDAISRIPARSALAEKSKALAVVYRAYESRGASRLPDKLDIQKEFIENISKSKKLANGIVWVFGYDYISPIDAETIVALAGVSAEVNVLLTGERTKPFFGLTGGTEARLLRIAEREGVSAVSEGVGAPGVLRPRAVEHIEKYLYRVRAKPLPGAYPELRLVKTGNPEREAEAAAAAIVKLIRDPEKGYRYRDIAVICNDTENRARVVKRVFERFGLPVFMDKQYDVSHDPVVVFISALADIRGGGRKAGDVLTWIKTGLTDIDADTAEELENYAAVYGLKGKAWGKPLFKPEKYISDEVYESLSEAALYVANRLDTLDAFLQGVRTASGVTDAYLRFLKDEMKLEDRAVRRAEELREKGYAGYAEELSGITEAALGILEQVGDSFGDAPMSPKEYAELLKVGFAGIKAGMLPSAADNIVIGTMQRTRTAGVRALFVLGANEGELPLFARDEGLFNEDDKKEFEGLGLHGFVRGDEMLREEQLAIYKNFSKPEDFLFVSCTGADSAGKEQVPSQVFEKMRRLFPDTSTAPGINAEDVIVTEESAFAYLAEALTVRERELKEPEEKLLRDLWRWYREKRPEKASMIERGLTDMNRADTLDHRLLSAAFISNEDLAEVINVSPSSIEAYSKCPFAFLMKKGLELRERRRAEMDSRVMGDVYHAALKNFGEAMSADGLPVTDDESLWRKAAADEVASIAEASFEQAVAALGEELAADSDSNRYRLSRLKRISKDVALAVVSGIKESDTKEMYFEERFARGAALPSVDVEAGDAVLRISGRIDRVDISSGGGVWVHDYKSGSDKFDAKDVENGVQLQLFLYLKAASAKGKPAGVSYFSVREPLIDISAPMPGEDMAAKLAKEYASDGISAMSDPEGFARLSGRVDEILSELAESLAAGAFPAAPKTKNTGAGDEITTCTYCGYGAVCGYNSERASKSDSRKGTAAALEKEVCL